MTEVNSLPPHPPGANRAAALSALALLVDAGIDVLVDDVPRRWLRDAVPDAVPDSPKAAPARPAPPAPADDLVARLAACDSLDALAALVAARGGRAALLGDGNPAGGLMVLGDMPSADDMAAGRLFADAAGQLLDRMLAAIGRDRADSYLANLLLQPTPGGRAPDAAEIAAALPLARRHIELVRPRALLLLGGTAAAALLGAGSGISRLRGKWQRLELGALSVPVLASFAPAYLRAQPGHKALAWRDLQLLRRALSGEPGAA